MEFGIFFRSWLPRFKDRQVSSTYIVFTARLLLSPLMGPGINPARAVLEWRGFNDGILEMIRFFWIVSKFCGMDEESALKVLHCNSINRSCFILLIACSQLL
jgi:hypothetical protein